MASATPDLRLPSRPEIAARDAGSHFPSCLYTSWCCPSRPCVVFLACVHLALFLALSLSPRNSLVSSRRDHSMLASLLLTVPSLLQLCSNCSHRNTSSVCPAYTQATRLAVILTNCLLPHYQWLNMIAQLRGVTWSVLRFHRGSKLSLSPVIKWTQSCEKRHFRRKTHKMLIRPGHWVTS